MVTKGEVFIAAAQLTAAAVHNLGDKLVMSADVSDPNTRAENLEVWEIFRIFYAGLVGAANDEKDWPGPGASPAPVQPAPATLPNPGVAGS